jgi:hypothetical protein
MARFIKGTTAAVGGVASWSADRARASFGASHRRASIQGQRARGVSPADVLSTTTISRPRRRVSIAAYFKAFMRWGFSRSGVAMASSSSMAAVFFDCGGGQQSLLVLSEGTESLDLNVFCTFLKGLCVRWLGQLYMYPPLKYLYLYAYLYVFFIQSFNKKKKHRPYIRFKRFVS